MTAGQCLQERRLVDVKAVLERHATESVAERTGDAAGGLLNATLGNLTELVIAADFYLAQYAGEARPELRAGIAGDHEDTTAVEFSLAELARMADSNELADVKTLYCCRRCACAGRISSGARSSPHSKDHARSAPGAVARRLDKNQIRIVSIG
jgi:hypothetical protein